MTPSTHHKSPYQLFITGGILVYVLVTCVDRLIHPLPDALALPVLLLALTSCLFGLVMRKKTRNRTR